MSDNQQIQIAKRGVVTIPKNLRKRYNLQTGDVLTLIDLDGIFVLSPQKSVIDELAVRITKKLIQKGETLESMLKLLGEKRKHHGRRKTS